MRGFVFLICVIGIAYVIASWAIYMIRNADEREQMGKQINELELQIQELETELEVERGKVQIKQKRIKEQEDAVRQMLDFLDQWEITEKEVTGYAPLDSDAQKGMCYSGDPNITASGTQVVPGVTAAGELPFGTEVFIPGLGLYEVQDRGGMVGKGQLDITFHSRDDALRFGRQTMQVAIRRVDSE